MPDLVLVVCNCMKCRSSNTAPLARAARIKGKYQRDGTPPRAFHLRRVSGLIPRSDAAASMTGQISMRRLWDGLSHLSTPKCPVTRGHNSADSSLMVRHPNPAEYKKALIARVKAARVASGLTQEEVALAIGATRDRVLKYESRTPLPTYLIEPFAEATGQDPFFILTGRVRTRVELAEQQRKAE